jgi:membrane protease YdiL (CAAX protease family)/NAD-dependent dihydropyrimidine dehydrogenase PreA subunit
VSAPTPLKLNTAACDRCGRCAPLCTPRALRVGPGYISVDWEKCTACGKCAEVCEPGAIRVRSLAEPVILVSSRVVPIASARGKAGGSSAGKPAGKPRVGTLHSDGDSAVPRAKSAAVPVGPVAWTLPEAGLVLLVAFALLLGAQALPGGFASAPVWAGITLLAYDGALAGLLYFLARRRGTSLLAAFRLDSVPDWRSALIALGVGVGCWLFSVVYRAIALGLGATPPASDGVDLTRVFGSGAVGVVLTVAVIALAGPVLEEVLLRGVVLGAVAARVGAWPAIVGCAVAFALLHASLWSFLPLTVLGVGLGWLATRSRTLWPAIGAHVLYNAVLVAAAFYAAR